MNKKFFFFLLCVALTIPAEAHIGRGNTGSLANGLRHTAFRNQTQFNAVFGKRLVGVRRVVRDSFFAGVNNFRKAEPVKEIPAQAQQAAHSSLPALLPLSPVVGPSLAAPVVKSVGISLVAPIAHSTKVPSAAEAFRVLFTKNKQEQALLTHFFEKTSHGKELLLANALQAPKGIPVATTAENLKPIIETVAKSSSSGLLAKIGAMYTTACATVGAAVVKAADKANDYFVGLHAPSAVSPELPGLVPVSTPSPLAQLVLEPSVLSSDTVTGVSSSVAASAASMGSVLSAASSSQNVVEQCAVQPMLTAMQKEWLVSSGVVAVCAATVYGVHLWNKSVSKSKTSV